MHNLTLTAATLRAILCYIDPENTPKIAYDNDALAIPLINKLKEAVGNMDGSQMVYLPFSKEEKDLLDQFVGVCKNIQSIFTSVIYVIKSQE